MNKYYNRMMIRNLKLCCFIFFTFSLVGCGPSYYYKYSAPTNDVGRSCVQHCAETRNQCRQVSDLKERNSRELAASNQRNYQSCAAGRSKKDIQKYCNSDSRGYGNYGFDNFSDSTCKEDFNQCFEICGGSIERILEKG